jgi:hypothetical protein
VRMPHARFRRSRGSPLPVTIRKMPASKPENPAEPQLRAKERDEGAGFRIRDSRQGTRDKGQGIIESSKCLHWSLSYWPS